MNEEQKLELSEFISKWSRSIDYYAYMYANEPRVSKDDLISAFYERICVFYLKGNKVVKFGETAFIKLTMYRLSLYYNKKNGSSFIADICDNNDDDTVLAPSVFEEPFEKSDNRIILNKEFDKRKWKESWREILYLHFEGGYNLTEIARMRGVSHQAITEVFRKMLPNYKLEIGRGKNK